MHTCLTAEVLDESVASVGIAAHCCHFYTHLSLAAAAADAATAAADGGVLTSRE